MTATCKTCPFFKREEPDPIPGYLDGECRFRPDMPTKNVAESYWCGQHPERSPAGRIARALDVLVETGVLHAPSQWRTTSE